MRNNIFYIIFSVIISKLKNIKFRFSTLKKKGLISFITLIKNFKYFHLFFFTLIIKKNVFLISNPAIGHYPINFFISLCMYGKNNIYVFKSHSFHN